MSKVRQNTEVEEIYLHFNLPEHYLPIEDFVNSAEGTKKIINNIAKVLFEDKLKYQIVVKAPEKGTLLETIGLIVTVAGPITIAANAYIKGYTGKGILEHIEELGKQHKEEDDKKVSNKLARKVIVDCTKNFLEKENNTLIESGIDIVTFKNAYIGKNQVFEVCDNNESISSIGFTKEHIFPVTKESFKNHILLIESEVNQAEQSETKYSIEDIYVTSPEWEEGATEWRARDKNSEVVRFEIRDKYFWALVKSKEIQTNTGGDSIQVQWLFEVDDKGKKIQHSYKVVKVLKYNGKEISKPLKEEEIISQYINVSKHEDDDENQIDMFVSA